MRLLALILMLLLAAPAQAQQYVRLCGGTQNQTPPVPASASNPVPVGISSTVNPSGVALNLITNTTANIPNISTTVTLAAASSNVTISTASTSAVLYVDFTGGTATSGDYAIQPGASITYCGIPAVSTFKIIGASATGTYSVFAH
jgi:hypothetical protein